MPGGALSLGAFTSLEGAFREPPPRSGHHRLLGGATHRGAGLRPRPRAGLRPRPQTEFASPWLGARPPAAAQCTPAAGRPAGPPAAAQCTPAARLPAGAQASAQRPPAAGLLAAAPLSAQRPLAGLLAAAPPVSAQRLLARLPARLLAPAQRLLPPAGLPAAARYHARVRARNVFPPALREEAGVHRDQGATCPWGEPPSY